MRPFPVRLAGNVGAGGDDRSVTAQLPITDPTRSVVPALPRGAGAARGAGGPVAGTTSTTGPGQLATVAQSAPTVVATEPVDERPDRNLDRARRSVGGVPTRYRVITPPGHTP